MTRNGTSPAAVYTFASAICLIAPALGSIPVGVIPVEQRIVWSYVLLAGVPLSVMAMLLAGIHATHGLIDAVYRMAAIMWVASTTLLLAPLEWWGRSPESTAILHWARIIATALVALLFVRLAARVWKLPWKERVSLALAFGWVALFFGYRAGRYIIGMNTTGLEATAEALAEFFVDAVFACVLLLPAVVTGWVIARTRHERPAG
jgi:uncharacterized membrane protein YozB (DUF420 family)